MNQIYVQKEVKPWCKKAIFEKNLIKSTKWKQNPSAIGMLFKQVDGCPMCRPISAVVGDIYMPKMEFYAVVPTKSSFNKCYFDYIYVEWKTSRHAFWRS